jgi:amino acid transporter
VSAAKVDLAAPVSQLLSAAFGVSKEANLIVVIGISAIIVLSIAQYTVIVAETSRLPLVAGWDGLLPRWFTRLHLRHRTPARALWFVVLCSFGLATLSLLGVGRQEAFQLVITAAQAAYGLYYIVLFTIPLVNSRRLPKQPSLIVRVCSALGLMTTLTAIILQVVPIIDVPHPLRFGAKVATAIFGANLIGTALYKRERQRCSDRLPDIRKDL